MRVSIPLLDPLFTLPEAYGGRKAGGSEDPTRVWSFTETLGGIWLPEIVIVCVRLTVTFRRVIPAALNAIKRISFKV